ncbi:MAG TPA: DUF222 domain-containing protein [Pseudonocardiaceae bacterium]
MRCCPLLQGNARLVLTIGLQQLIDGLGSAILGYGGSIDAATARRLACDSCVVPVVLGGDSQPLDVGLAKRSATAAIRAGLAARDGGCAWPGCDTPVLLAQPAWRRCNTSLGQPP